MSLPHPRVAEPADPGEPSDIELIARVKAGSGDAYGLLYERHVTAARRLARQLTRSPAEVDDLVAEAFAKVLDTLRSGGGPDIAFRAYLLTTLRNTLYDRVRRDRRLELSDDMTRHDPGVPWVDTAVADLEASLAARAFARLPERWQTVLWHTEVEQETPAQVAPVLGLSPNGVAALAYRAREGLRQAYLREHLSDGLGGRHRWTVERLGAWARHGLSTRDHAKVDEHLADCDRCRPLAAELREVNGGLRGLIAPLILGTSAAAAYLSSSAAPEAAGAAAGTAATAAAAATAGTATTSGSVLSTVTGWATATTAGKAAAVAAVVVAGTAVGVGVTHRSPSTPLGAAPAAADPLASRPAGPGLPEPGQSPAATGAGSAGGTPPGVTSSPSAVGAPVPPGPQTSPGPGTRPDPGTAPGQSGGAGNPEDPENGTGSGRPPSSGPNPPGAPSRPAAPPASTTALNVGTPAAVRPLQQGKPGEIGVPVRNAGPGAATALVANVTLPPGITVRAGGSSSPTDWHCTGSGQVATCRISTLPAGGSGTVRVKVFVSDEADAGTVTGRIAGAAGLGVAIPTAVLQVQAK